MKMMHNIEKEYLLINTTYNIENTLISVLTKKELVLLIKNFEKVLYIEKLKYSSLLRTGFIRYENIKLSILEKYFIEKYHFFFHGGKEIKQKEERISKLKTYYRIYHSNNTYRKNINLKDIPIMPIISMYLKLPSSLNRNIRCPLHKDKTASFRIYKNTNSFYCFGCGRGGNIINFISQIENISNKEAFKKILKIYN